MRVSALVAPLKHHSSSPDAASSSSSSSSQYDDEILISYHDATLRRVDLQTLRNDEWLNDAVIAFCYEILSRQFKHLSFWPPAVAELLCTISQTQKDASAANVDGLLPQETLASFIPVSDKFGHPNGVSSHWTCLYSAQAQPTSASSAKSHIGAHFDSMKPSNSEAGMYTFKALAMARNARALDLREGDVPNQANASDCGLYVILLPFAHLLGQKHTSAGAVPLPEALQATAAKLSPSRIAHFRSDLRAWLEKWAEMPRKQQIKLTSWEAIQGTIGPLDVCI